MARLSTWILALALCAAPGVVAAGEWEAQALPTGSSLDQGRGGQSGDRPDRPQGSRTWKKWWTDPGDRAELGITDQQSARIEQIFQDAMQLQRPRWTEFVKLEADLNKVIKDGSADAALVQKQVDRVETLRAELQKNRTMMIYRMHQVLSAEQRAKLQARFDREHRGKGTGPAERRR